MENKKTNILLITIYFPPFQHIASNRLYSFAKYLDKDKYNVYVLTIERQNLSQDFGNTLFKQMNVMLVPDKSLIKRAKHSNHDSKILHNLKSLYNVGLNILGIDPFSSWVKESVKTAKDLIENENIEVVISSFGPISAHIVALILKKKYGEKIKWIADMRDEFITNANLSVKSKSLSRRTISLEKDILSNCDGITSVSLPILNSFKKATLNDKCEFAEIRNGFDFDLENQLEGKNKVFRILYVGSFYGDTKPSDLLRVLEIMENKHDFKYTFEIIGNNRNTVVVPSTLNHKVKLRDEVSHEQAIKEMKAADLLILIIPTNKRKGVYSGKLFEYLGSLTPIMAIVPHNDVAAELVTECNAGFIVDSSDYSGLENALMLAYNNWLEDKKLTPHIEEIKKYHRSVQVKTLEDMITKIVNANR